MIESFNSQLGAMRALPILSLLEHIKRKIMKSLMKWFANAKALPSEVPPRIERKVDVGGDKARHINIEV